MNPDLKSPISSESGSEPVPFAPDFVERVFREAKRSRSNSRRTRTFAAGAMLVAALVVVGRMPRQLRHLRPAPHAVALLAVSDLDAADDELYGQLVAEEDADADPVSYFIPEPPGQSDGQTEGQADDGDDSDLALF